MRSRLRSLLLLPVLVAFLLEGIAVVRPQLAVALHRAYPEVVIDAEGRVVYFDTRRKGDGRSVLELDATRNTASVQALGPQAVRDAVFTSGRSFAAPSHLDSPRFLIALYAREWRRRSPLEHVAENILQPMEARRRRIAAEAGRTDGTLVFTIAPGLHGQRPVTMPVEWRVEDGRLVCRERATRRVLAGLGPGGYAVGEHAAEGERFGHIDVGPINANPGLEESFEWLLLDREGRRLFALSAPKAQAQAEDVPSDSTELTPLTIETRHLHPVAPGVESGMPFMTADRNVLVFLGDGSVVCEFALEPGEHVSGTSGSLLVHSDDYRGYYLPPPRPKLGTVVVETVFARVHPDRQRRRVRIFHAGQPEVVHDVLLVPTRAREVFLAHVNAALVLLRPPPLAIASAVSTADFGWWWRDPWLSEGSYPGWLALSLALAAFCAWRARRAARERCATPREVRLWTGAVFLLGPVGLLWMKFVLPQVPVEAVGQARRAVDLDASPSTDTPWPDPKRLGTEVFS